MAAMTKKTQIPSRAPLSHPFDLAGLPEAGKDISLHISPEDLKAVAAWIGVDAVDRFQGKVRLKRKGSDAYRYEADFSAEVTQSCVVTLAPVHARLEGTIDREIRMADRRASGKHAASLEPDGNDEGPEIIEGSTIDLFAPVLEEMLLAVDPYPRAEGAVFESEGEKAEKEESPFAVLRQLKKKD